MDFKECEKFATAVSVLQSKNEALMATDLGMDIAVIHRHAADIQNAIFVIKNYVDLLIEETTEITDKCFQTEIRLDTEKYINKSLRELITSLKEKETKND